MHIIAGHCPTNHPNRTQILKAQVELQIKLYQVLEERCYKVIWQESFPNKEDGWCMTVAKIETYSGDALSQAPK